MRLTTSVSHLVAAAKTTTTNSSSSSVFLLVIIVLFGLFYFLMIRPNQRRRMQAMRQSKTFDLGDEVVAAGMVGRVVRIGDGEVDVEISDGVVVQFVPQAVQLRSAYMAGPRGRGLGAGGPGSRPGSGMGGGSGMTGGSATIGRRAGASDAWPEDTDSPLTDEDTDGVGETGGSETGFAGGTGSEGGASPSGEAT